MHLSTADPPTTSAVKLDNVLQNAFPYAQEDHVTVIRGIKSRRLGARREWHVLGQILPQQAKMHLREAIDGAAEPNMFEPRYVDM